MGHMHPKPKFLPSVYHINAANIINAIYEMKHFKTEGTECSDTGLHSTPMTDAL
jgi:hypothetical protein